MKNISFWGMARGGLILIPLMAVFLFPKIVRAEIIAAHLVISEIQTGLSGAGNSGKDFIEIYNPTDSPVDLEGYRLVKRTKTGTSDTTIKSWTTSTVIPARTYYLWANNNYGEVAADVRTSQTIADNNALALRRGAADTGEIIDAVAWGENASGLAETANFSQNIPDGQSLARMTETNNNSADFGISSVPTPLGLAAGPQEGGSSSPTTETPSPTETTRQLPPEVFLSEFLADPAGDDGGREWVEVFNKSFFDVDLGNWAIDDGSGIQPDKGAYLLPVNSLILAGAYKAFIIPKGRFSINNTGGDSIRLFSATGALQDIINFSGTVEEGKTYAKDSAGFWRWTSLATPDLANQFIAESEDKDRKPTKEQAEVEDLYKDIQVVFNEVFANPKGADEGEEWVELQNLGKEIVDISGWFLDDAGKVLSKNAYRFPTGSIIPAGGLLAVKLPDNVFTITNSGDEIRLFSPDKEVRRVIILPVVPENKSYARKDVGEQWLISAKPTFAERNIFVSAAANIEIARVEPASEDGGSAVVLKNNEAAWVDLSFWQLRLGDKEYTFPAKASLPPKSEMRLSQEVTDLHLTSKNLIKLGLFRPDGQLQFMARDTKVNQTKTAQTSRTSIKKTVSAPISTSILAQSPLVAGESDKVEEKSRNPLAEAPELPIIIKKGAQEPFSEKVKGFFCSAFRFLRRCD